jgi:ABC-type phosphate transport system substrate-binding protein
VLHKNKTFPLSLALLLSFGVYLEPTAAVEERQLIVAQAQAKETTFPLPNSLPEGSVVKVSSSQNVESINNNLKQKFEEKYSGAKLEVSTTDSDAALTAIAEKKADLAAISRPLTEAEAAQGFKTVPINREKIAIIVGEDNPYNGNLTIDQFAKVFRGEFIDWSEIGGISQPIRVIDRVDTNDTRRSFPGYPVFQSAEFKAGTNATVPSETGIEAVVKELRKDGISYAPVSAVKDLKGIKVVEMHQTLPDDPRYPFSQPNLYVYQGELSDAAKGFLGFVTAPAGQGIIQETIAIAKPLPGVSTNGEKPATDSATTNTPATTTAEKPATDSATTNTPATTTAEKPATDSATTNTPATTPNNAGEAQTNPDTTAEQKSKGWLWWLLPLALLIPLLAFLAKKGKDSETIINEGGDGRDLVGAGVSGSSPDPDRGGKGIVAGTTLATGLGAAAIANRRQEQSNLPNKVDLDATVEGVRNKFDDATTDINPPNSPNLDVNTKINTPDAPNLGGTVDNIRTKFNDATTNINTPNTPNLGENANINTANVANLGGTVDNLRDRFNDATTNINTPNAANFDATVEGVRNKFDDATANINTPDAQNLGGTVDNLRTKFDDATAKINTPDAQNLGGTVDNLRNKFDDATANINTPNAPNLGGTVDNLRNKFDDATANINTPNAPNLGGTVDNLRDRFNDATTNINTPDAPNLDGTVDNLRTRFDDATTNINTSDPYMNVVDINRKFDDAATNINTPDAPNFDSLQGRLGDNLNPLGDRLEMEAQNTPSNDFLDRIKNKAEEMIDDVTNKTSEGKDNLTGESDRQ